MVKKIGNQKNQPYLSRQQGVFLYLSVLFLTISGCQTNKSKSPNEPRKGVFSETKKFESENKIKTLTLLTNTGENSQAVFSPTGTEVLFVSANRESHDQSQIYLFDLNSKRITRITYSDGSVFHPFYAPNGEFIMYSSDTDEKKEQPDLTRLTGKNAILQPVFENEILSGKIFPGFEIYIRRLKGDSIQRLKRASGYDVAEDLESNGKRFLVTSHRGERTEITLVDIQGTPIQTLHTNKNLYKPSPRFVPSPPSRDTKKKEVPPIEILWIRLNSDNTKEIVISNRLQKESRKIFSKNGQHANLAVSPDGQSFAFNSNFHDPNNQDIFIAKIDGSCTERLTADPAEDLFPSFSPDGKKLLITSKRSGHFEVYLVDLNTESNPTCLP